MPIERREVYRSSNDDRWYLSRDADNGHVFIQHQGNASSGGHIEDLELAAFLSGPQEAPEKVALRRLLSSLVDQGDEAIASIPVEKLTSENDE